MNQSADNQLDRVMLALAARAAVRGVGDVEPNPPVGCVIARRAESGAVILGVGAHRALGGPHAEIIALDRCRDAGHDARGAAMWVTLEPCAHHGRTPPCVDAIIAARPAEIVIARRDPNPAAAGGAELLELAGVNVRFSSVFPDAIRLTDPFVTRMRLGRPWVTVKWAQSIDGRIADRAGVSKWISNPRSRLDVHRRRARADAIITGIGTARADNPMLTARGVRRVRRAARRIVVDHNLELDPASNLARTARDTPTIVWCAPGADADRAHALESLGVIMWELPESGGRLDLAAGLCRLAREHDATRVLVEAGPGLVGDLAERGLIDEVVVYVAPLMLADANAIAAVGGLTERALASSAKFRLERFRRFGDDAMLCWRRPVDD